MIYPHGAVLRMKFAPIFAPINTRAHRGRLMLYPLILYKLSALLRLKLAPIFHSKITFETCNLTVGPIRRPQTIISHRHTRHDGRISTSRPLASMLAMGMALKHCQVTLKPLGPVERIFTLHRSDFSRNIARQRRCLSGPLEPKCDRNSTSALPVRALPPTIHTPPSVETARPSSRKRGVVSLGAAHAVLDALVPCKKPEQACLT